MPREPLLNFDELLAPVPGDTPAGAPDTFREMRPQLEELRREVTPERAEETKEEIKNADWRGLERKTKEILAETSKDLRIGAYLAEALVKEHGFPGARDGLTLLRRMTAECWDRMYPENDPEDPDFRAGPYNWIDDANFGLRFPTTLKMTPLLFERDEFGKVVRSFSFLDCRPPEDKAADRIPRSEIDRAAAGMPPEALAGIFEEVDGCLTELNAMTEDLAAKLGAASPGMGVVRGVLDDCRIFLQQIIQQRPDVAAESDKEAGEAAPGVSPGTAGAVLSRTDLYRQVGVAAQSLRELEPHSPIPYLLLRAVELGVMPFPKLMQELIRDANVLTELKRELGIKEEPPPEG